MQVENANPEPFPVVVFGLDDQGKGHASRFELADAALAERAAGLMGMRVLRLTSPEEMALAAELPSSFFFLSLSRRPGIASGRAFVPFLAKSRFERLAAAPGAFVPERPADIPTKVPGPPDGGRFASSGGCRVGKPPEATDGPGTPAADWTGIKAGSLVLAAEESAPGIWYVATVVTERGDGLFELRWYDWPNEPLAVRRRAHLGLFPPAVLGGLK
jgi:hypothetical protein